MNSPLQEEQEEVVDFQHLRDLDVVNQMVKQITTGQERNTEGVKSQDEIDTAVRKLYKVRKAEEDEIHARRKQKDSEQAAEKAQLLSNLTGTIRQQSLDFQQMRAKKKAAAERRGSRLFESLSGGLNSIPQAGPLLVQVEDIRRPVADKPMRDILKLDHEGQYVEDWRIPREGAIIRAPPVAAPVSLRRGICFKTSFEKKKKRIWSK